MVQALNSFFGFIREFRDRLMMRALDEGHPRSVESYRIARKSQKTTTENPDWPIRRDETESAGELVFVDV
jgi:hypothetical protein